MISDRKVRLVTFGSAVSQREAGPSGIQVNQSEERDERSRDIN